MNVDLTLRLGDILVMAGLFSGSVVFLIALKSSIRTLGHRLDSQDLKILSLAEKIDGLTQIIATQARHDERLRYVEQQTRDNRKSIEELAQK